MHIRRDSIAECFRHDARGSAAPAFVLLVPLLLAAVGAAIDYSRASSANIKLQAALDATALAMSAKAPSLSASDLTAQANTYFSALFTAAGASNPQVNISYSTANGPQVVLTGSASVKTLFLGVPPINATTINIASSTTIAWGNTRLRLALVLDNTGSMANSGKLTALKTATQNLLTQLQTAAVNNGDVYVSIVPFVKDVNVGSANYNASWIDWTDWNANNGTCVRHGRHVAGAVQSTCTGTWTPAAHSTWNGCITDRGATNAPSPANYDANVTLPDPAVAATLFPAEQYGSCPLQLTGLSYNWTSMSALVNQMTANGNTNQAIGLAWGWQSLAGGGPFTVPPTDPNFQYNQVIILLSDGLNTEDRWYQDQAAIDARQQITCSNIKAAGITVYTVQVNTTNDPTSTLLQNCASDADKFFLLTSASDIITTFTTIGTKISRLRIAK